MVLNHRMGRRSGEMRGCEGSPRGWVPTAGFGGCIRTRRNVGDPQGPASCDHWPAPLPLAASLLLSLLAISSCCSWHPVPVGSCCLPCPCLSLVVSLCLGLGLLFPPVSDSASLQPCKTWKDIPKQAPLNGTATNPRAGLCEHSFLQQSRWLLLKITGQMHLMTSSLCSLLTSTQSLIASSLPC